MGGRGGWVGGGRGEVVSGSEMEVIFGGLARNWLGRRAWRGARGTLGVLVVW